MRGEAADRILEVVVRLEMASVPFTLSAHSSDPYLCNSNSMNGEPSYETSDVALRIYGAWVPSVSWLNVGHAGKWRQ